MVITLAAQVLCHGADRSIGKHCGPIALAISPSANLQPAQFIRATNAVPYDRANLRHEITFGVTRLFATPAEAHVWALTYAQGFTRSGTLTLDEDGATISLANTVADPPQCQCIGVSVRITYRLTGGAISEA